MISLSTQSASVYPGARSAFSRNFASALPTNAFQLASAATNGPAIAVATAGGDAQPTPQVAAANVPLPPAREVPAAMVDTNNAPNPAAPVIVANVPLPPVS